MVQILSLYNGIVIQVQWEKLTSEVIVEDIKAIGVATHSYGTLSTLIRHNVYSSISDSNSVPTNIILAYAKRDSCMLILSQSSAAGPAMNPCSQHILMSRQKCSKAYSRFIMA